METIVIPSTKLTARVVKDRDIAEYEAFAAALEKIDATLDYKQGARDWCYHLEEHGLLKSDFDKAEVKIGVARKKGFLPVDFTLDDETRAATGTTGSDLDGSGVDHPVGKELEWIWDAQIQDHLNGYCPVNWYDYQPNHIELLVEKKGLSSMLKVVAQELHVNLSNGRGDTDIISIANMHRRFQDAQERGQQPVLLYFGDFDPKGLRISELMHHRFEMSVGQRFKDGTVLEPINLEIHRIGLNPDTIEELKLSKVSNLITGRKTPIKGKDGRMYKPGEIGLDSPIHPEHWKPYVQEYLKLTNGEAWKVEANALVVRPVEGRKLLRETVVPYLDQDGISRYNSDLKLARSALKKALPDFLSEKLKA